MKRMPWFRFRYNLSLACMAVAVSLASSQSIFAEGFEYPLSIVAHGDRLFVADRNLPGVWEVIDGKAQVYFQASKRFRTPLNAVRCVAVDNDGKLLAGDSSTREVFRFDEAGQPQPLTDGGIGIPMAIAVHSSGDLYVADLELHRIVRVPAAGGRPEKFVDVPAPRGVAFDADDRLWIVSHGPHQLLRADAEGKLETIVEGRPFQFAHTVIVNSDGVAFVADGYAKTIWRINLGQKPEKWVTGAPLVNPVGLTISGDDVLVADPRANALFRIQPDGKIEPLSIATAPKPQP